MAIQELKEKWEELFIRFNTSPKLYLKIDFLKLIKFLNALIENGDEGALHEDDLKTLNGESLVGNADIKVSPVLSVGNAISLDSNTVAVTSHQYDSSKLSSAFGHETIADGKYSIAEGYYTTASGESSHAEGCESDAINSYAHAEGYYTTASGESSHAEGNTTTALGESSHAEGAGGNVTLFLVSWDPEYGNTKLFYSDPNSGGSASDSAFNFLAGSDFQSDALYYNPASDITEKYRIEKTNKFAGWIGRTLYLADGSILGIITRFPDNSQGEEGSWFEIDRVAQIPSFTYVSAYIKTGAAGEYSHSEGYLSDAAGKYSHAEGERIRVTGTAAHGEGTKTQAYGAYSHAEGELTQALAFGSHSEGKYTHAEGEYTHVEGYDTKASGLYAHAEGIHSSAQGEGSHAEGYNCTTDGNTVFKQTEYIVNVYDYDEDSDELTLSINEGSGIYDFGRLFNTFKTILFRNSSNAKFYLINYKVSRFDSDNDLIILGKDESVRSGASCIKQSENIYIDNDYKVYKEVTSVAAHAEGKDTEASETASHSEGINTRAEGDAAHAEGVDSKSLSRGSHAEGINTFVNEYAEGSHTEGRETQVLTDYAHAEGYKTVVNRSNSETGENKWNNCGGHAEGGETLVEGTFAHAEGEHTKALNRGAHSEGFNTQAKEKYSHAEGWYTEATHKAEHAEGRYNKSNDVHINTSAEYVDLDLPSGNLWATCNIGATNPEDYGDYYAWGETETKETYDWSTYKWCNGADDTLTKYCTSPDYWGGNTPNPDELTRLVLEDDIAAKTLGENWRIPSKKDFEELIENTDQEWNVDDDWCKFISRLDSTKYIILPIAGNSRDSADTGYYWTSDLKQQSLAQCFTLELGDHSLDFEADIYRKEGCSIRPVSSKLKTIHSVGVGESDGDHRNALEITTDGSIFVKGVGDYDGSNPQSGKSLQLLLLNISGGESGLAPETAIVIAAALNDLNDRINAIPQSQS